MPNLDNVSTRFSSNSGDAEPFNVARSSGGFAAGDWAYGLFGGLFSDVLASGNSAIPEKVYGAISRAAATSSQLSQQNIAFEKRRARLVSAINKMKVQAPTWDGSEQVVGPGSAATAERFLLCLTPSNSLPKVGADGEGDVLLIWEGQEGDCIVVAEQRVLHLVSKPGTPDAAQVDAQQFLGWKIPDSILRYIP